LLLRSSLKREKNIACGNAICDGFEQKDKKKWKYKRTSVKIAMEEKKNEEVGTS